MANRAPKLKTAYRPSATLEVFYTGGAACLSSQGNLLACACSDEVKVSGCHRTCTLLPNQAQTSMPTACFFAC